jgi:L-malate glycosyltransferase
VKRIALIRNSYPFDIGGAERFPISLAQILSQNNYESFILSANNKTLAMAKAEDLQVIRSPWWSFQNFSGKHIFLFPLYAVWQIYLTLWYLAFGVKNNIDIYHPQSRDDFISATFAAKLSGKRVIWTDHADLKYVFANHKKWYKNPVGKLAYTASKLADQIILASYSEKELIEKTLGKSLPAKYTVTPIGVIDVYKPVKRTSHKVIFVSTSRLVKAKGISELIEAFKLMNGQNTILKLCGDGPEATHFKSQAHGVKNIEFLGHVNDVTRILKDADVFVHPSHHESFGLSLVEAEMCELPIIACRVGSIPEIVKEGVNGIFVRPKNIKDLVEAMRTLAENRKLRIRLGQAGRLIYLDNFQLDKIVKEKYLPLYEKP